MFAKDVACLGWKICLVMAGYRVHRLYRMLPQTLAYINLFRVAAETAICCFGGHAEMLCAGGATWGRKRSTFVGTATEVKPGTGWWNTM